MKMHLSQKWAKELASKPETGMGYQVVSVVLKDGKRFDQIAVVEGTITEIRGRTDIPFAEHDIAEIILTHDKWNFPRNNRLRGAGMIYRPRSK